MLADVLMDRPGSEDMVMLLTSIGQKPTCGTLGQGAFLVGTWSPASAFMLDPDFIDEVDGKPIDQYGVCDDWEQVMALYGRILKDSEDTYAVCLKEVRRDKQSSGGVWRWHKWGPYIGHQAPKHEYLYDEDIDVVYTYHIYKVED